MNFTKEDQIEIERISIEENVSMPEAEKRFILQRAHRSAEFIKPCKPNYGGINEQAD